MSGVPEVLIVTHDPSIRELTGYLTLEGIRSYVVTDYANALRVLEQTPRCVAVVDTDIPKDVAFQIYELLHEGQPVPTLLLVSPENYQQFALDAHRVVTDEFVMKPMRPDALVLHVKALAVHAGFELPTSPLAAAPALPAIAHPEGHRDGSIIAVFGTKGGVGKSTIAVNLAIGLAQDYGERVLLVDADLWFGDVGVLLNLPSTRSLFDAFEEEVLDTTKLLRVLTPHESGASLLLRPADPSMAERIDANSMTAALTAYRQFFDYIIVDMHSTFDELNLQILEIADRILMCTTPEISAIHNTARFLAIADTLAYGNKLALLLNRANTGLQIQALEQQLGMDIAATVVSAGRLVVEAANRGVPIMMQSELQTEEIYRNLQEVIAGIAGRTAPAPDLRLAKQKPRSGFGGLIKALGGGA